MMTEEAKSELRAGRLLGEHARRELLALRYRVTVGPLSDGQVVHVVTIVGPDGVDTNALPGVFASREDALSAARETITLLRANDAMRGTDRRPS